MTEQNNKYIQFIPGLIQGLTRVTISYPVDIIKVNMQKQIYKNSFEALKDIYKRDINKFYRGSSISYITIGLERSIQYYYLEKINKKYNSYVSGFIVSMGSSIYNLPMQYLTTNIALVNKKDNSSIKKIYKNTKFIDLYKGYFVETPKNILGSTIYLGTYLKLRGLTDNKTYYPYFGGISGILVWLIIFPIDTIKTEYQTTKNISVTNIILNRYKIYGIKSFYIGIIPILMRTFPSAFIGMYMYEKTKEYLNII
jgi:solute carrier family 25 carnitine/acylcarnitine transporter 20/29